MPKAKTATKRAPRSRYIVRVTLEGERPITKKQAREFVQGALDSHGLFGARSLGLCRASASIVDVQ